MEMQANQAGIPPGLPDLCSSLVEILRTRARLQPQQTVFTFLRRARNVEREMTFAELDTRARAVAARIQQIAAPGDCVAVICPNDLHFIEAFMGCQYAGTIPVPSPSLQGYHAIERLRRVLGAVAPMCVVTTTAIEERLTAQRERLPELLRLPHLCVDSIADADAQRWSADTTALNPLAFLQFTSGSLSTPKGVRVSHDNILHNLEMLQQTFGHHEDSRIVSWLPFFHDWGLIGGLLQPIYSGIRSILFDPFDFVRSPVSWLEVISRYRATVSGAPNFAYDQCCSALESADCSGLDLQSWTIAIVGAEPIRDHTLNRFAAQFAAYGFSKKSFFTSYGLAESTLVVTGGPREERAPRSIALDRRALEVGRVELTQNEDESASRVLVSCGPPLLDQEIRVVDPQTHTLRSALEIGEVWISGPSVTQGYWNQDDDSDAHFRVVLADTADTKRYLRSGDMGFLYDGELYLTGRIKDLIIVNGRNLYPEDVELVANDAHVALRSGKAAVFSVDMKGAEQYVIAQEMAFGGGWEAGEVIENIRRAVVGTIGTAPGAIVLVKAGGIPRTSSGKIRRQACKQRYLAGELGIEHTWLNSAT